MSCYSIYYKDGAKMMRPVPDREEYLKLRGTRSQVNLVAAVRRGEVDKKSLLLQMNYSCLPNDDGSLKGSTRMSTSVGMDIDWTPSPLPNEGEEQIAARKEEWLRMVPELVLSKKEELGLLMLERSATKGYHLVFRVSPCLPPPSRTEPGGQSALGQRPPRRGLRQRSEGYNESVLYNDC